MRDNDIETVRGGAPTRRECLTYGGAVVGGSLLAGCTGGGDDGTGGSDDEWAERGTWVEWFDDYYGEDAPIDPDSERFRRVRERSVDEQLSTYLPPKEIDARATGGHKALAAHVDSEAVVEAIGEEELLGAIDDGTIDEYAENRAIEAR